ncbi:hypothetical protein [uncultured Sphingomonas sp.]|uniref:hypothetical protein n=1 Tax=uncultured Sphingomonas sp. TaxID=158754 RepID=UPI0025FA9F10|nr:hypothetical protein [uncultured Sphingomonas sp.]
MSDRDEPNGAGDRDGAILPAVELPIVLHDGPHAMPSRPSKPPRPSVPMMEIASGFSTRAVPLGLDGAFELRGGDRLGPNGIACDLAMDWHPALMRLVEAACDDQRVRGRPWFTMPPTLLSGPAGVGRTHIARRISDAAGVPHLVMDVRDHDAAHRRHAPDVPMPITPVIGMALTRCANPVVTVINVDDADREALAHVARLLDVRHNGRIVEPGLGATLDLSQVTWLVQSSAPDALRDRLRDVLLEVRLEEPEDMDATFLVIDLIAEVIADHGLDEPDAETIRAIVHGSVVRRGGYRRTVTTASLYDEIARQLSG